LHHQIEKSTDMKKQLFIKRLKLLILLGAVACWKYSNHSVTQAMTQVSTAWQKLHHKPIEDPGQCNVNEEERTGKVSSILIFPFIK
jgi:hypothetical protein